MAEEAKQTAEGAKPEDGAGKKKPPIKIIAIFAVLMIVQAAGIVGVMSMTGPKAAKAEAVELKDEHKEDREATVEIQLVDDRFQNMQTGRVWIWDTEIVLQVKAKHEADVAGAIETRGAEIREGIATIFRRAQHSQLREPGLETLNRQLLAFLNKTIGKDAEHEDRVRRILIPKCKGFPAE